MATIALYANKINQMPGLIQDVKKSVMDYKSELSALKRKSLQINRNICNLDDVVNSIQTSSQTQEQKIASLETFQKNSQQFIVDTVRADSKVAEVVRKSENNFYDKYSYLKPECKKNGWEKFCDGCKAVGEWCKEHWKIIVTVVIVIAAVVAIVCTAGTALGPIATILIGAAKGAVLGSVTGGLMGGLSSMVAGGSFLDGFEDGAFSGALTGALFGGIGGGGQVFGKAFGTSCKMFENVTRVSMVSGGLSLGMTGFDLLSFGAGMLFGQDNPLTVFNSKLHSNNIYNSFQFGISVIATFSGSAYQTMKPMPKTCFIAGTMILTASGYIAIENIKVGDKVISTNSETFETKEKAVLETYVREVSQLVHLTVNGEQITTTADHPFYVENQGFINAGELHVGSRLLDLNNNILIVEEIKFEITKTLTTVYNFQVDDFHTYHVGNSGVLVHNADYSKQIKQNRTQGRLFEETEYNKLIVKEPDTVRQITIKVNGTDELIRIDFISGRVENGVAIKPHLIEAKSSNTARFTRRQQTGYPNLAKNGGVVVGKGKGQFVGGVKIPPVEIDVVRPSGTSLLFDDIIGKRLGGR